MRWPWTLPLPKRAWRKCVFVTLMAKRTPKKFDVAQIPDRYTCKLTQLIEAKVAGQEIVAATASQPLHVINLVEALQKSLAEADQATADASPSAKTPTAKSKPSSSRRQAHGLSVTFTKESSMSEPMLPAFIQPMLAVGVEPFDDGHFLFEIKWDGVRMLAFIDAKGYRLRNRHGTNTTVRYPEFDFLVQLPSGTILDGEMVVLRHGQPDFALVQSRDKTRSSLKIRTLSQAEPATFMAFDLLYENYSSLLAFPLPRTTSACRAWTDTKWQ